MEITQNHGLYLIGKEDTFSPDPLNENAQMVDEALQALDQALEAEAQARQEAGQALEERVAVLEAHRVVTGSYTGKSTINTDSPTRVSLGFAPKLVVTQSQTGGTYFGVAGRATTYLSLGSDGFTASSNANSTGQAYRYCAIG